MRLPVSLQGGVLERVVVEDTGIVRLEGWANVPLERLSLKVSQGTLDVPVLATYCLYRPDVHEATRPGEHFLGFAVEFLVRPLSDLAVTAGGQVVWRSTATSPVVVPAYDGLLSEEVVLGRERIYGNGPPAQEVAEDVLALALELPGSVLDVGCGAGALVRALRSRGKDAHGIEIDREEIRSALREDVRPHVSLYDGAAPLPFPDRSFDSVSLVEVLEHIPNHRAMLREVRRVARRKVLLTVPDASAIPRCFSSQVVPWHLLELTHVNFFTAMSLRQALEREFRDVTLFWIQPVRVNSTVFHTSVAAVAVC